MRIRIILVIASITLSIVGCTSYDYSREKVQQGNLLSLKQLDRLKMGMTKEDAAILMGTSLISPTFQNNRWDYAYTWQKRGQLKCIKSVSLFFSRNTLTRVDKTDRCQEDGLTTAGPSSEK